MDFGATPAADFGHSTQDMPELHELYGPDFDFAPTSAPPRSCYMIASTPRSGSTHLASCLWRAGDLGAPLEYLNPIHIRQMSPRLGARGYLSYWRGVQARRTSPNGVFGHKLFMPYYVTAGRRCPALLPMLRSDLAIHLYRRDKIAQAVSLARAQQTKAWASWSDEQTAPVYDARHISTCLNKLLEQERWWAAAFELTGAVVLSIAYEDYVGRETEILATIRARLGLPAASDCPPVAVEDLARQRDGISAEWVARFKVEAPDQAAIAQELGPPLTA